MGKENPRPDRNSFNKILKTARNVGLAVVFVGGGLTVLEACKKPSSPQTSTGISEKVPQFPSNSSDRPLQRQPKETPIEQGWIHFESKTIPFQIDFPDSLVRVGRLADTGFVFPTISVNEKGQSKGRLIIVGFRGEGVILDTISQAQGSMKQLKENGLNPKLSQTTISGQHAQKIEYFLHPQDFSSEYLFTYRDYLISLDFNPLPAELKPTFDKMLQTFKLVDRADASRQLIPKQTPVVEKQSEEWKTFKSINDPRYQIEIPSDWIAFTIPFFGDQFNGKPVNNVENTLSISNYPVGKGVTSEDYASYLYSQIQMFPASMKALDMKVSGQKALLITFRRQSPVGSITRLAVFVKDQKAWQIRYEDPYPTPESPTFNKLLSSFKLLK